MVNEKKEWKELLESTNKKLLERGFELRIYEDEEGYYSLDIFNFDLGEPETYAENYFETELCDLIYEAVAYINGKTSESAPKEVYVLITDIAYDYDTEFDAQVFSTREKAWQALEDWKASNKVDIDDIDDVVIEETGNGFSAYEEGYASRNHYYAYIKKREIL